MKKKHCDSQRWSVVMVIVSCQRSVVRGQLSWSLSVVRGQLSWSLSVVLVCDVVRASFIILHPSSFILPPSAFIVHPSLRSSLLGRRHSRNGILGPYLTHN